MMASIYSGIFYLIFFVTSCAQVIDSDLHNSIDAAEEAGTKYQEVNLYHSKKLNELSEIERKEFIEEIIPYLKTVELAGIIKSECYENKSIENSNNCLELRAQCSHSIKMNADSSLREFSQELPEISLCLNKQFSQSVILPCDIINSFKLIIDFMETMHNDIDCPTSWEQFTRIAEKIHSRYGKDEMEKMKVVDDLFYHCLHTYIFR